MTVAMTDEGVDVSSAVDFLAELWGDAHGYVYVSRFDRRAERGDFKNRFEYPAEMDDVREYIETHATTHELFFCPFVHKYADSKRKGASVERRWVCVDQDRPMTNQDALRPTLVVESGTQGHSHLYYSVPEGVGVDEYQAIAQGIGDLLGCGNDKTTDEGFFRVPGTLNFKHDPPVLARVDMRRDVTYAQQDLSVAVNVRPSAHTHDRVAGAQDRSQGLQFERVPDMRSNGTMRGNLNRELERISQGGDGSGAAYAAVKECREVGYSPGQVATILREHAALDNVRGHYATDEDLLRDVERIAGKVERRRGMGEAGRDADRRRELNLTRLMREAIPPRVWLIPGFIEQGTTHIVGSQPGHGKSLLALDLAVNLALGREALPGIELREGDSRVTGQFRVLYVDDENPELEIRRRLHSMGLTGDEAGLSNFHLWHMPDYPSLDSKEGGTQFIEDVRELGADLVILDTISSFVTGDELGPAQFADFYQHTLRKLRADKRTVIILDHLGKDHTKGLFGSSAKSRKPEGVWMIDRKNAAHSFELQPTKDRTGALAERLTVTVHTNPTRHSAKARWRHDSTPSDGILDLDFTEVDEGIRPLVEAVDDAGLDHDAGRVLVARAINKAGLKAGTEKTQRVIAYRKARGPAL